MTKFFIEQVALYPSNPGKARELLAALGLDTWHEDLVVSRGEVFGEPGTNVAQLAFNYQATRSDDAQPQKPLELEVLHYEVGPNWVSDGAPCVSHFGMHCSEEELAEWRDKFTALGIRVAQEVFTQSHTNPAIAGKRWYRYVIFDTSAILGVDLKFIVRRASPGGDQQ